MLGMMHPASARPQPWRRTVGMRISPPGLPALRSRRPCLAATHHPRRLAVRSQYAAPNAAQRGLAPVGQPMGAVRPPPQPDDIFLNRSFFMDKQIITRTTGKRLGWVNQLFVDPTSLSVVALYLRQAQSPVGAPKANATTDKVYLRSVLQISDVLLVHDEKVLMDPPADETCGFYRLVGSVVRTQDGLELGKVRDYSFNPDNGQISTIKYDALGIPAIPAELLSTYCISWQEVLSMGPAEVIVRSGAVQRALKETNGLALGGLGESFATLLAIVKSSLADPLSLADPGSGDNQQFRTDAAYAEWYAKHGKDFESYTGEKMPVPLAAQQQELKRRQPRQEVQQQPVQVQRALPPPQAQSYNQTLQQQQPAAAGQPWQQAVQAREAVPAGWGAAAGPPPAARAATGWGQPPPPPAQKQGWASQGLADVQFPAAPPQQQQPPAGRAPPAAGPRSPPAGQYPPPAAAQAPYGAAAPQPPPQQWAAGPQQAQAPYRPPPPQQQQPQWAAGVQQAAAARPPPPAAAPPAGGLPAAAAVPGAAPPAAAQARPVEPDAVIAAGSQRDAGGRVPLQQAEFAAAQQQQQYAARPPPPPQ